ncbi:ubiquitin activating enzyme E1 [Cryptosporidium canis]|uniref:Ubiquitin activating enzyme E1 n=1 Tax=Cryptosporidium canis TaxID=195482 RepID=A0A9D5HX58_9CRYT|nr:ubiquitin activating enzyme E1 [Cryptosporidium canis]
MSQLRLRERLIWGETGEEALKASRVLILGFSILASELAVSLVSSGIIDIVLVDDGVAAEEDYGVCLGLDGEISDVVNRPKVQLLKEYLLGLQAGARVECILESPESYLENIRDFSSKLPVMRYDAVVCCNLPGMIVEAVYGLASRCHGISSPFILNLKSRGHLGQYQIYSVESSVITFDLSPEAKNLANLYGLQLCRPFESLIRASCQIDLQELESGSECLREHLSKIPFPLLLVHIGVGSGLFGDSGLNSNKEGFLRTFQQNLEQIFKDYEYPNYCEARRYQNLIFSEPERPFGCQLFQIMESQKRHSCIDGPSLNRRSFSPINQRYRVVLGWIHSFLNDFGRLPVSKKLPEMHCDTLTYLQLQKLYDQQYHQDVSQILDKYSRGTDSSMFGQDVHITPELIQFICDHLYCLRYVEFKNASFRWGELSGGDDRVDPSLGKRLIEAFLDDQESGEQQLVEFLFLDFLDYFLAERPGARSPEALLAEFRGYLGTLGLDHVRIPSELVQR